LDNSQIIDEVEIAGHRDTAYNGKYKHVANSIANGKKRIYKKDASSRYRSMFVTHLAFQRRFCNCTCMAYILTLLSAANGSTGVHSSISLPCGRIVNIPTIAVGRG
jgi:hypothetical protein